MVEINGNFYCENCFEEKTNPHGFCTKCGYNPEAGMSDPTMLTPGSILLGKYIVGKVMGKGGFGVTYLAFDVAANKKVAIKEFFPYGVALRATGSATVTVTNAENADAFKIGAEKFYNEAKLVSKFNGNPNIVGVYEFFYENDTVYFAMEYLKGHTLKEHIDKNGPLSAPQTLFIAQSVANALMAAHSSNVLHRDISPDNIIICDNGDVKLIDFGAARQVVAEHSQSFSVILKPGFAPLEQYQKKGKQGPWTDIYSLGATLYYALTEDIPDDPMSRMSDDEEYSSNLYNINPELWRIISKATQLKIEDRYGDIFQLKNDLSTLTVEAQPLVVPPAGEAEQMPEFRTAMPYGMTQMGGQQAQPIQQPVGIGAPAQPVQPVPSAQPVQQAVPPAGYYQTTPAQPAAYAQQAVPAAKKPINKKTAAIAISAAAAAAAAAIIIPISVNSAKNSGGSKPAYSTPSYSASANNNTTTNSQPSTATSTPSAATSTPSTTTSKPSTATSTPSTTTSKPSTASLEEEVEAADRIALRLQTKLVELSVNYMMQGYGAKYGIDRLKISVDGSGNWSVTGINPDHWLSNGGFSWSASASGVNAKTSDITRNVTHNLLHSLSYNFPDIKNASIYVVLIGNKCPFVAYSPNNTNANALASTVGDLVNSSGIVTIKYKWDGKTAGVTPDGKIIGTIPKIYLG